MSAALTADFLRALNTDLRDIAPLTNARSRPDKLSLALGRIIRELSRSNICDPFRRVIQIGQVRLCTARREPRVLEKQIAAYLLHRYFRPRVGYGLIGRLLNRDHTTVLRSERLIARRIANEPDFARMMQVAFDSCRFALDLPENTSNEVR